MLEKFKEKRKLGAGAFGEVWLVHDLSLDVEKAVKIVDPFSLVDSSNFYQEAQVLRTVNHPNIVRVEEAGKLEDGRLYIAMEFLKDGSVEAVSQREPLQIRPSLEIMGDCLKGLQFAHDRGIIHRDIKPANILIGPHGEAKLSDFGLATRLDEKGKASLQGYLFHVAPETFDNEQCDKLSDVYAAGVTMYRLLNGDQFIDEFDLSTEDQTRELVQSGAFPPRDQYRLHVPRNLVTAVNRAMNLDPSKRYQSADEFRHALEAIHVGADWIETPLTTGTRWDAVLENGRAEVVLTRQKRGEWQLVTTKVVALGKPRRVGAFCGDGLTKARAEQLASHALAHFLAA